MNIRLGASSSVLVALALTLFAVGVATAQDTKTQKTDVFTFEVISVDGNNVVIKDSSGARELTVPDDFRFTVDGKPTSVHDLKAGMKGTAAVTTTTTTRPVYVTTVKKGTVVRQAGTSVWVKTDDGTTRKFTKSEIDARGIKIIMDGKPTRLVDLKAGDTLTATIVTPAPPEVLTQKEVQAVLDAPLAQLAAEQPPAAEPPAAKPAAAEAPAAAEPAAATETVAAESPPADTATPVATATTPEATPPAEKPSDRRLLWIGLVVIIVVGAFLLMRRRRAQP